MQKTKFHLLSLTHYPIYDQLLLEEALLRTSHENWCLINRGTPSAVVMGISGKKEELINPILSTQYNIPLIKRFSGGGTVLVDEGTLFISFIAEKQILSFPAYPERIMKWSEEIYAPVFANKEFSLKENDYVLGNRKCGGNAQYIKKDRWLHHTSFLWNYCPQKMQVLLHPKKTPPYRQERPHAEFLCTLSEHFATQEQFIAQFIDALEKRYCIQNVNLVEAQKCIKETRQGTCIL